MIIFLLFQALATIFISGGLFFKESILKNRSIALYFVLFGLEILYFLYGTSNIPSLYPEFYGRFYFSIGLMYGPILYFHFRSVIHNKQNLKWNDLLHFSPLILLNLFMLDRILMSDLERVTFFNNQNNFFNYIIYLNYIRAIHQFGYAAYLIYYFKSNERYLTLDNRFYLGGLSVIYILTTIVISSCVLFASSWQDFAWYYIFSNALVLLILYVLYNNPKIFQIFKAKYKHSSIDENDMAEIKLKVEKIFNDERIYLNNNLSIDLLSTKINVQSHHISQTFSNKIKESFNDFVNRHRVEHSKKLLLDPENDLYKIEAIAFDSGFNNKVTFYKAFSKFVKTTPSKYRKGKVEP